MKIIVGFVILEMTLLERLFPIKEVTEKRIQKNLEMLEKEDVPGLDVVINSIIDISNSGLYDESRRVYDSIKSKFFWWERSIPKKPANSVYSLAHQNLDYIEYLDFIPHNSVDLITFFMFVCMYDFLAIRYSMTIKRELDDLEVRNVYLSRLDEQLIFGLDNFDKIHDWPQPTPEFFQKLKKIRWENKNTKKFSDTIGLLKIHMTITSIGLPKYAHFSAIEKAVIELIAGCSAVKDNREFINKEDVVIGFKTYLKLLNTDVTKYKAPKNHNSTEKIGEGYLVCNNCREYYELQPGESPNDFTDECKCGGKLEYYPDITWLLDNKD
nr:hypothetical protein [uncultured Methanobacterium sp.]